MEGGPKSLKAGLKLDDEGRDGEGTEEPGQRGEQMQQHAVVGTFETQTIRRNLPPEAPQSA